MLSDADGDALLLIGVPSINLKVDTHLPSVGGWKAESITAVSVPPVPKAAYRSDFREKDRNFLSAARFDPGTSRAAGKRATNRPLRPASDSTYDHDTTTSKTFTKLIFSKFPLNLTAGNYCVHVTTLHRCRPIVYGPT